MSKFLPFKPLFTTIALFNVSYPLLLVLAVVTGNADLIVLFAASSAMRVLTVVFGIGSIGLWVLGLWWWSNRDVTQSAWTLFTMIFFTSWAAAIYYFRRIRPELTDDRSSEENRQGF